VSSSAATWATMVVAPPRFLVVLAVLLGAALVAAPSDSDGDTKAPMAGVDPKQDDKKAAAAAAPARAQSAGGGGGGGEPRKPPTVPLPSGAPKPQAISIEQNSDAEIETVCRSVVKGWLAADGGPAALKITPAETADSLLSWRVDAQPAAWCGEAVDRACSVMVQRYGDDTEQLVDRAQETALLQALAPVGLPASGFDGPVPSVVGTFANGRVEAWLEGWEPLTLEQLRDPMIGNAVAQIVARLHKVAPQGVKGISAKEPSLWRQTASWLKMVGEVNFDGDKDKAAALGRVGIKGLHDDLLELQENFEYFAAVSPEPSQVAFSHNDLQAGKIMIKSGLAASDPSWPQLTIAGFEYSDYNLRSFDIASHINALAGPGCDWSALPSEDSQKALIRAYLGLVGGWPAKAESLYKEVQLLRLASNLHRGVRAVLESKASLAPPKHSGGGSGSEETTSVVDRLAYAGKLIARFRAEKEQIYVTLGVKKGGNGGDGTAGKADAVGDTKGVGKHDAKLGKHEATARKLDKGLGHDL
jgi:thiamine kinase-like enzyme